MYRWVTKNKWLKKKTYSPENLLIILVIADFKNVTHKVIDPSVEQQGVRDITLVRNRKPELQIFFFLL